jgi:hypothetical protein
MASVDDPAAPSAKLLSLVQQCRIPYSEVALVDQLERVREHLRGEVDTRLRAQAGKDPVERPCRTCGAPVEIPPSTAAKSGLNPQCPDCKWPERAARQEAEAAKFVVLLGDTPEELARAIAALR